MDFSETVKKAEGCEIKQEKQEDMNRISAVPGAQLTIFYNGSVCVYDAVTPEKAQAIMLAAAAAAVAANNKSMVPTMNPKGVSPAAAAAAALTRSLSQHSSTAAAASVPGSPQTPMPSNDALRKLQAEIPIARRQSLQHFLEKRRNRIVSKAPYASEKKPEGGMEVGMEGSPQLS